MRVYQVEAVHGDTKLSQHRISSDSGIARKEQLDAEIKSEIEIDHHQTSVLSVGKQRVFDQQQMDRHSAGRERRYQAPNKRAKSKEREVALHQNVEHESIGNRPKHHVQLRLNRAVIADHNHSKRICIR